MNGDQTTAAERTYVRFAVFVEGQIPSNNAPHPIPENSAECLAPLCPIHRVIWISDVRASFGPIHLSVRMSGKHSLHQVWLPQISMPRNRFRIFPHFLIIEFPHRPPPEVVSVTDQPYLRLQSCLFDCVPQLFPPILDLHLLPTHSRSPP